MNRNIQRIGKSTVRYYREKHWDAGTCWVYLVNGPDEGKHNYLGKIVRTENPRRYNGRVLKVDASLKLLVEGKKRLGENYARF